MSAPLYIQQADGSLIHIPAATRSTILNPVWMAVILIAAHVPLALAMREYETVSTIHALAALGVGLWLALSHDKILQVAYLGAYLTGAEVLWRMTAAQVPWEFGKYATGVVFMLTLLRNRRFKVPLLPLFYFVFLLPGIVPTAMNYYFSTDSLRQMISSNLSGPFALMACAWFFSHLRLRSAQVEKLFLAVIAPTVGIAVIALFSTLTADHLRWGTQSNFVSSGGFGPNQVSGALGLGALLALLLMLRTRSSTQFKIFIFVILAFLAIQSALTFSRGGIVGAAGAALIVIFYLIRERQVRTKLLVVIGVIVLATFVILPGLDRFTNGALSKRFENTSTTGRTQIAESDLEMWDENFVFGVGVGMALYRDSGWRLSHTEFTRMPAEHGLFGVVALALLLIAGLKRLVACKTNANKAVVGSLIVWSLLFMADKAMRLVAPSFMYGLAFATFEADEEPQEGVAYRIVRVPKAQRSLPAN